MSNQKELFDGDRELNESAHSTIQIDQTQQSHSVDPNDYSKELYLDQADQAFEEDDAWEPNNQKEENLSLVSNQNGYIDYNNDHLNIINDEHSFVENSSQKDWRNKDFKYDDHEAFSSSSLLNENTPNHYMGLRKHSFKDYSWKNEPVKVKGNWKKERKRYCGDKFSRKQFICIISGIIILLLASVMIPVIIYSVIPSIIRSKMEKGDGLLVKKLVLTNPTDSTINFQLIGGLKPDVGSVQISHSSMSLLNKKNKICDIILPADFKIDTKKDKELDILGQAKVLDFTIPKGAELDLKLNSNVCWGWFCYSNIDVVFGKTSNLIKADNLNEIILKKWPKDDLVAFGEGSALLHIGAPVLISIDKDLLSFSTTVSFENPTKIDLDLLSISINYGDTQPQLAISMVPTSGLIQLRTGLLEIPMTINVKKINADNGDLLAFVTLLDRIFKEPTLYGPLLINTPSGGTIFTRLSQNLELKIDSNAGARISSILLGGLRPAITQFIMDSVAQSIRDAINGVLGGIPRLPTLPTIGNIPALPTVGNLPNNLPRLPNISFP